MKAYKSSTAKVITSVGDTRWFEILRGVKQGDVLSALLFCIAIGVLIQKLLKTITLAFLLVVKIGLT